VAGRGEPEIDRLDVRDRAERRDSREKIRAAAVVVTCTAYNVGHMRQLCPEVPPERIRLVHHGVDAPQHPRSESGIPTLLAAGRLIEKKGFDTLVDACRLLAERGVEFRCRIFGTGPLLEPLRRQVQAANLASRVDLPGFDAPVVLQAIIVLLLLCIGTGVAFALVARGRSRLMTCAIAIPFGFAAWIIQVFLTNRSPATVIEALASGLALAVTYLWYERRLTLRGGHGRRRRGLSPQVQS